MRSSVVLNPRVEASATRTTTISQNMCAEAPTYTLASHGCAGPRRDEDDTAGSVHKVQQLKKMPAESQQVPDERLAQNRNARAAELIDSHSNTSDFKVLNVQEAAAPKRVAAGDTIQTQPADERSDAASPDQERSPAVNNELNWPALPTTITPEGEESPRKGTRDVSQAGKREIRASFKEALEQGAAEAAAQPPLRHSPARPRKHATQKREACRRERQLRGNNEEDFAWFGAVGDAEREYSRRTRRSRQSSQSRDRRMALKAAGNSR